MNERLRISDRTIDYLPMRALPARRRFGQRASERSGADPLTPLHWIGAKGLASVNKQRGMSQLVTAERLESLQAIANRPPRVFRLVLTV